MLTSSESLCSLACKEIVLDTEQVCKASSLEGRESQHFGCLEGIGAALSVLSPLICHCYWLQHLQALLEEDHQLRDTWIKNCCLPGMGDQCAGLLVQQGKSREDSLLGKDPRPSFQGSSNLNSATDRTVALQSNRETGPAFVRDMVNPKIPCFLTWIIYLWFCHLFLMHVCTPTSFSKILQLTTRFVSAVKCPETGPWEQKMSKTIYSLHPPGIST